MWICAVTISAISSSATDNLSVNAQAAAAAAMIGKRLGLIGAGGGRDTAVRHGNTGNYKTPVTS